MLRDNRGVTLIELMVSITLLAIVIVMAGGLISASSRAYQSISADVDIQYESQLATSQIQESVIDCTAGICYSEEDNSLYVVNECQDGFEVKSFRYDSEKRLLLYDSVRLSSGENYKLKELDDMSYLSSDVSSFSAEIFKNDENASVEIFLDYLKDEKKIGGGFIVAARNKVTTSNDINTLLDDLSTEEEA